MKIILLLTSICLVSIVRGQQPMPMAMQPNPLIAPNNGPFAPPQEMRPSFNNQPVNGPPVPQPQPNQFNQPQPQPQQIQFNQPQPIQYNQPQQNMNNPQPVPQPQQHQYNQPQPNQYNQPQQHQYNPQHAPQPQQIPYNQPQQNEYIPPLAPHYQQGQKRVPISRGGKGKAQNKYQNPVNDEETNFEQEVMDGVDGMAEELVEAIINRLEADEALAVEMEIQGIDPDETTSSNDRIHPYSWKMYIMMSVAVILYVVY